MGIIMKNGVAYGASNGASEVIPLIAPEYDSTSTYDVDDCVYYNDKIYKCKTQISSGESWNSSHWEETTITDLLNEIINSKNLTIVNKTVTQNGTYNPSSDNADGYGIVTVNVPQNSASPTGTLTIVTNGTYDVSNYASATVNVQYSSGSKTITENGTFNASDDGLSGFSSIIVNVAEKGLLRSVLTTYNFELDFETYATDEDSLWEEIDEEYDG